MYISTVYLDTALREQWLYDRHYAALTSYIKLPKKDNDGFL